ncbi:hypothetical protein [Labrys miyagiensis]
MTSFSVVSLIAMVPDSEWSTPTLMVSSAAMTPRVPRARALAAPARLNRAVRRLITGCFIELPLTSM